MSAVGDAFIQQFGKPSGGSQPGFAFSMEWDQVVLDDLVQEIGVGFFQNGFLYLLGEEVAALNACLAHWRFIFDDDVDRKVIGRNGHGSLLLIENESELGTMAPIGYLDLPNCKYSTHPDLDFIGLIGNWLPNGRLGDLLDDTVYKAFLQHKQTHLQHHEIVAMQVPLNLGGTRALENFQIEDIFQHHASIASVYRNAMQR